MTKKQFDILLISIGVLISLFFMYRLLFVTIEGSMDFMLNYQKVTITPTWSLLRQDYVAYDSFRNCYITVNLSNQFFMGGMGIIFLMGYLLLFLSTLVTILFKIREKLK